MVLIKFSFQRTVTLFWLNLSQKKNYNIIHVCVTYKVKHVRGADSVKLVGHVPIELSFITNCFLQTHPNNFIIVEITGPQRLENGLAVPGKFTVFTRSAAKLKEQIMHIKELCKHMELEMIGSDLRKRNYSPALMQL